MRRAAPKDGPLPRLMVARWWDRGVSRCLVAVRFACLFSGSGDLLVYSAPRSAAWEDSGGAVDPSHYPGRLQKSPGHKGPGRELVWMLRHSERTRDQKVPALVEDFAPDRACRPLGQSSGSSQASADTRSAHLRPHDVAESLVSQLLRHPALALRIGGIRRYPPALSGGHLLEWRCAGHETCRGARQRD
jgi:hypothetical protein